MNEEPIHFSRLPPDLQRQVFSCCSVTLRAVVLQLVCRDWWSLLREEEEGGAVQRVYQFASDLPLAELGAKIDTKELWPAVSQIALCGTLDQLAWLYDQGHLSPTHEHAHRLSWMYYGTAESGDVAKAQWLWDHGFKRWSMAMHSATLSESLPMMDWVWEHGFSSSAYQGFGSMPLAAAGRGNLAALQWLHSRRCPFKPHLWAAAVSDAIKRGRIVEVLDWLEQHGCSRWEHDKDEERVLVRELGRCKEREVVEWFVKRGLAVARGDA